MITKENPMSRIFSSISILPVLFLVLSASDALAGNGAWMERLRAEREAAQNSDANQASIGQNRDERSGERQDRDDTYARGWGRGGRNFMRADQGDSHNAATTDQNGSGNFAGIRQFGQGLNATITQDGNGNSATIRQWGRGSTATISQTGSNNAGCVIQVGRNVSTDIAQTGGQSTGIIQTPRGTREVPVELCTQVSTASRGFLFGAWRR